MKTSLFLWMYTLIAIAILAGCNSAEPHDESSEESARQPNILFIMSDDHAYQAISAYDDRLIHPPHIDRIASEGMLFERAFVTNSICAPSRAVILTGKHSHLNGLRDNGDRFDGAQQTISKLFQQNGYHTAIFGKWHLKTDPTGFDTWKVLPGQGHYYNPEFRTSQGKEVDSGYVTDLITDFSLEWIDQVKNDNKPFFLVYQHKAPHREWLPKEEDYKAFTKKTFPEPATLFDDYSGRGKAAQEAEMRISDHMGLTNDNKIKPSVAESHGFTDFLPWYSNAYHNNLDRMSDEERQAWDAVYDPINEEFDAQNLKGDELTSWKYQRYMQDYLGSIAAVDNNVGRVLDYLEENDLADNTVVIYTSDQGFYLGEHGWFDKRFMYEESFRTPLMIRWPGVVEAGSRNSDLVQNLDFAQTMLDMAGIPMPEDMQGKSMVPLLKNKNPIWRKALYYHYYEYPGIHAVKRHIGARTDQYKLIHFYDDIDEWELFDLESDPDELSNVYDTPEYSDVQDEMHEILMELAQHYKDSVGMEQAKWRE